ncbi:MAG: hypothetical protein KC731_43405, partial [Myxococcales bacterium]|nr:hypothetical protein [Myxococcales bacterium]
GAGLGAGAARPPIVVDPTAPLYPLLKPKSWPHQALAVTMPLPGVTHPDAPLVAFARNQANDYVMLTKQEAPQADVQQIFQSAVKNLSALPIDIVTVMPGIAMSGGADLTADRLLDPLFLQAFHRQLGALELLVAAPHRRAIYAMAATAPPESRKAFEALVRTELTREPPPAAPVSELLFSVVGGQIQGAQTMKGMGVGGVSKDKARGSAIAAVIAVFLFLSFGVLQIRVLTYLGLLLMAVSAALLHRPGHKPIALVSAGCFALGIVLAFLPPILSIPVGAAAWATWGWATADELPKPELFRGAAVLLGILTLLIPAVGLSVYWLRSLMVGGIAGYAAVAGGKG